MMIAAMLAMTTSVAIADEVDDAHRLAVSGRDAYWNCLAREYPRDSNKAMSEQDFTSLIASVCASERQNFRVSLVDFLSLAISEPMTPARIWRRPIAPSNWRKRTS